MYNHNKAQQSKNRVHISWDILYMPHQGELNYNLAESIQLKTNLHVKSVNKFDDF